MEMAFSPPKPLSMISVFHDIHDDEQKHNHGQGNNCSPLLHAQNIPDQTQPSPTFSQFAPKSGKKRDAESTTTPSFRSFKQIDTRRTPFTATPVSAFSISAKRIQRSPSECNFCCILTNESSNLLSGNITDCLTESVCNWSDSSDLSD